MPLCHLLERRLVNDEEWQYRSSLAERAVSCKASQSTFFMINIIHGFSSDVCMRNFVHGDLFRYFLMI